MSADKLHLFTDAAKSLGYGLVFGSKWIYGEWDQEALDLSISVLEMYPIALAFLMFSHNLKGRSIIIHIYNEALINVFQNKFSRDALILSMYRKVILTCLKYNIRIKAVHIPGKINIHADALSHLQISRFKDMAPWAESDPTSVPQHLLPENLLKIWTILWIQLWPHPHAELIKNHGKYTDVFLLKSCFSTKLPSLKTLPCLPLFVSFLNRRGLKASTIRSYLSAIGYVHRLVNVTDPVRMSIIQASILVLQRCGGTLDSRCPVMRSVLNRLLEALCTTQWPAYERTLMLVAFFI